jgi:signal transduction histidine kinase
MDGNGRSRYEEAMTNLPELEAGTRADWAGSSKGPPGAPDIAKLAHELRTPLGAIAALAEIMRDERLGPLPDARYRGYAADIHDSAVHALSVLSSFLEAETEGGGRPPMALAEVDVAAVAASSVSALGPLAERSGVKLKLVSPPDLPRLMADRRCLRQILLNLIDNAVKFTPPGGEVQLATRYRPGASLEIEVSDTGDGMTQAELARVLALSAAPEAARRRRGGFGLQLVRALAAANGGTLALHSTPGSGTRATVTFACDRLVQV